MLQTMAMAPGLQEFASAPFWLVLGGGLVRQDIPQERLFLRGSQDGLIVGRTYQPYLHTKAVCEDVSCYVGREHFRIERTWNRRWSVVTKGRHLLWRIHKAQSTEITGSLRLSHSDSIVIFTGADQSELDGQGSRTLYWTFLCPNEEVGKVADAEKLSNTKLKEGASELPYHDAPTQEISWCGTFNGGLHLATPPLERTSGFCCVR